MIKGIIHLLTVIMGVWVIGEPLMATEKSLKSNGVQIILYQGGKQNVLDNRSPYFQEVLRECERLFLTADSGYRLIISKERIAEIKKKQTALEVIYPEIQTGKIRSNLTVYFTKLLIPLTEEFSNGTVFLLVHMLMPLVRQNQIILHY